MTKNIYSAALGRDLALAIERNNTADVPVFVVYASDGDGNPLFDVAATTDPALIPAMLPTWTEQAIARQKAWGAGDRTVDWTSWPALREGDDKTGPIPMGRLAEWLTEPNDAAASVNSPRAFFPVLTIPVEAWAPNTMLDDPLQALYASVTVNGQAMHAEAWQVEVKGDVQVAVAAEYAEKFEALAEALSPDGPMATTTINGREYIVTITPQST